MSEVLTLIASDHFHMVCIVYWAGRLYTKLLSKEKNVQVNIHLDWFVWEV